MGHVTMRFDCSLCESVWRKRLFGAGGALLLYIWAQHWGQRTVRTKRTVLVSGDCHKISSLTFTWS